MNIQKHMRGIKLSFTFISLSVLLAFTGIVAIAKAQEATSATDTATQTPSDQLREQAQSRRAEIDATRATTATQTDARREAGQERAEARKAALTERVQQRVTNLAANMSNRMEAAITRIDNIANRLQTRSDLLAKRGVSTGETNEHIAAAKTSLASATDLLADIDALVFDAATGENPRQLWSGVRQVYVDVRDHIRDAHGALRAALRTLKSAAAEAENGSGVSDAVRNDASMTSTSSAENDAGTTTETGAGGDTEGE